jgi:hypothetical protein
VATPGDASLRGGARAVLLATCLTVGSSFTQISHAILNFRQTDLLTLFPVDRFDALKIGLPDHGVVCYLTDMDLTTQSGQAVWYLAEYSVAPVVLRLGVDCGSVVGIFEHPSAAAAIVERNGLQIVRVYDAGLMMLRTKRP